jgi:hypothetical protein
VPSRARAPRTLFAGADILYDNPILQKRNADVSSLQTGYAVNP